MERRVREQTDLAISVRDLQKDFRNRRGVVNAVAGVSFSIGAGERIACIGPNGAGKSTTIKMLTGILRPTSGEARVLGLVPWDERRRLASRIGVLFGQRSQLWAELTARQGLNLLGAIYRLDRSTIARRTTEVSELLAAEDLLDQPVRSLSLGQRMRCELAASMLHNPELLFLDEPTIGLDLIAKQTFRDIVLSLNEHSDTTLFLTSHDVADVESVAERVIVINHGRVIADGRVGDLRQSLLSTKLIEVRFSESPGSLSIEGAEVATIGPTLFKLRVDTDRCSISEVIEALFRCAHVADISVTDPPLEDVITHIYSRPV